MNPAPAGGETNKGDAGKSPVAGPPAEPEAAGKPAPAPGGMKSWLPLLAALVAMPLLAYAMTTFVLLPKFKDSAGTKEHAAEGAPSAHAAKEAPKSSAKPEGKEKAGPKGKNCVLSKLLVNVAGSMGSRYLCASLTLVPKDEEARAKMDENKDQLLDLASSTLSSKSINDLEKPGARNLIRSELITVFNSTLGAGMVKELYLTEFAVQ
jgi:flagellar protein FliL